MRENGDEIAFFQTTGTWLALFPRDALAADANVAYEGGGFTGFTLAHNVESREQVDAVLKQAEGAGGDGGDVCSDRGPHLRSGS